MRTRRIGGVISSADYPRAAERAGAEGKVVARLVVGANGRVGECRVRVSSGNSHLDKATCRLILQRFRFAPARDPNGVAIPDVVEWEQIWSLQQGDGPEAAAAQCRGLADNAAAGVNRRSVFMSCMAALGWRRE